jgi:hypothetical protein
VDTNETGQAARDELATLYGFVCFLTLALMTLTEQFGNLPGAVVAFGSGWYILRLGFRSHR